MTSLFEYYDMLEKADWTYEMSDDHSTWRRGRQEFGKLERIAKESPEHEKLYQDMKAHYWSDWHKTETGDYDFDKGRVVPKPPRPMEKAFRTGESNDC